MKPISTLLLGVLLPSLAHASSLPIAFTHVTVIDATGAPALSDETVIVTGEEVSDSRSVGHARPLVRLDLSALAHGEWGYPHSRDVGTAGQSAVAEGSCRRKTRRAAVAARGLDH
jgi:hypothetical protein